MRATTQQHLRRRALSENETENSDTGNTNKNPLKRDKDGAGQRFALAQQSSAHHHDPLEEEAVKLQSELGSVSYFPDHVARVSYIASVVKPDKNGDYLKELNAGMDLLATRLAPSFFPGTIVRHITTQVDGYFPAACPTEDFSNCQDVTASIGIYLSALPVASFNSLNNSEEVTTRIEPSIMTAELLAFQESFKEAIANNELQEAIRQEFGQKQDYNFSPAVVIVTDTINDVYVGANNGNNSNTNDLSSISNSTIGENDFLDSSGTTIDIATGEPIVPTTSIAAAEKADGSRKLRLNIGGIIGIFLVSLVMVSLFAIGRKRRGNGRRGDPTVVKVQEKIKKQRRSRRANLKNRDDFNDCDQSEQKLLGSVCIANSASDFGTEEEGFTGRTMRTVASESTQETLIQVVATSSSSYSLGSNVNAETTTGSSSMKSIRNASNPANIIHVERQIVDDLVANGVLSSDDLTSSSSNGRIRNNAIDVDASAVAHVGKYDDYEDENENDYVLDDDSDGSVGHHLSTASKSSEFCRVPTDTQHVLQKSIDRNSDPTTSQNISTFANDSSPLKPDKGEEISPYSQLDVAIANRDWATVGATAAVLAGTSPSVNHLPIFRRGNMHNSDFSKEEEELDKLMEAGDWHAVVVAAAKYDVGGLTSDEEGAVEEDANQSRTSTQGSGLNDSSVSMDNSSEGRSTSMNRSLTTSASQQEWLEEIRAQVTQLVREVVPDEEENVNEMMIQFKGREEDLLETLRSMKERIVTRKARAESRKLARTNTKPREKTEGFEASTRAFGQSSNQNESMTFEDSDSDQQQNSTFGTMDGLDELDTNEGSATVGKDVPKRVNPDEAAAAANEWLLNEV